MLRVQGVSHVPVCLQKQQSVLMSVITGEAVASLRTLEDKQVLQQCMATLRELFKEQVREHAETMRSLRSTWIAPVDGAYRVGRGHGEWCGRGPSQLSSQDSLLPWVFAGLLGTDHAAEPHSLSGSDN